MKRLAFAAALVGLSVLPAIAPAQSLPGGLGIGGQGMGGQPINLQSGGLGVGGQGMGGQAGVMPGTMGFVPGGQGMGGQGMSVNQYFGAMFMQGLAGRNGGGVRTGSPNPFANSQYPSYPSYPSQMQQQQSQSMSLAPPKNSKSAVPKLTAEERKANIRMLVAERKAKAEEKARQKKAKAAATAAKNAQAQK
jgi:hypothetical protein